MPHPPTGPGGDLPADPSPEPAPDGGRRPPGSLPAHDLQNPGDVSPSSSKQSCSSSLADSPKRSSKDTSSSSTAPMPPTGNRPTSGQASHNYSGKRKLQCLNVQVASTNHGDLIAVSDPVPGSRHDSKAINLCGWQNLLDSSGATRIAYITTTAITPIKKLPNQSRTNHDKDFNTASAQIRVNIEHYIAQLKTWRILSHSYHGRPKELPRIIHLATNLETLRTYTHNQPRK